MMNRIAIRKKIICLLAAFLHKKPKTLSRPQEIEEIKEQVEEVSSDVQINTIVMPIRITFDNPIDFNDHFSKPKDLKKDLPISFDSTTTSILPHPLLDSDSPFTAELSASVTLNSLGNEDKVFKPGILVYHAIHDKNLVTLEENSKENISSGTLLVFKEPSILLPTPEPPNECLKNVVLNFYQSKKMFPLHVEDTFAFIIWTFLPFFTYTKASPMIFSFQSENFIFDPGIITSHNPVWICQISQENSQKRTRERMSDQEAKDLKAEAREIMPQPSTNTLAEYMILSGADNRPPMLDKDLYDSWKSRMELYTQNREHRRMILASVENGLLICPTVEENGGLPADIYSLVNHHRVAKDLWERVQLLMQGTSLTKQERKCKLYDAFDKFTHIKGESLHKYYLRFTQLINDMNIYNMEMEQFQVNTNFLNSLPPEWSKFVTDVKLVKDFHTTNFDKLYAYLEQHELHANEVRLLHERNQDPLAFVANQQMTPPHFNTYQSSYNNPQLQQQFPPSQYGSIHPTQHYSSTYPLQPQFNHLSVPPLYPYQSQMNHQTSSIPQIAYQSPQVSTQPMTELPFVDSGFAVPIFSPGDDSIACLNKAMAFLTAVASSRFPSTNNHIKTSSNLRNQATIQDGRVTVQQARVVRCYNCQGEGHMARQCTQPKRPRNGAWYKDKAMLAEAHEAGQILDEEQLAFLADPRVLDGQAVQPIIPNNAAFQTEDLDTYDSDCYVISNAKAVLMATISNYGSDVISEAPHS
ncbi:integrase, catalytic region, zinc finger, CCHC-type containing protein [Tanacetum coccineum]